MSRIKSAIYISSEKIEAVGYSGTGVKIKVRSYASRALPEGTMMNGRIYEPASVTECLAALKKENPALFANPSLTVDGSSIITKKIPAPKLTRRQYEQLVRDDFAGAAEGFSELVCGYELQSGAQTAIFACGADREQVEGYISACAEAGVRLSAINVGVQAILNYVSANPTLRGQTFVLNVADGFSLLTLSFDKGVNVFQTRSRLYGESRAELLRNMLGNLSGLQQFSRSEKFNEIEYSYYLGLQPGDLEIMQEANPYPEIKLAGLDAAGSAAGTKKLPSWAGFVLLCAMLGGGGIDLLKGISALEKYKKRSRPKSHRLLTAATAAAAIALPVVYLQYRIGGLEKMSAPLSAYLADENTAALSAELAALEAETAHYNSVAAAVAAEDAEAGRRAALEKDTLDFILEAAAANGVSVENIGFSEESGGISLAAGCPSQDEASAYVDSLKQSALIADVAYTGYSSAGGGVFGFSLEVKLAGKEGGGA